MTTASSKTDLFLFDIDGTLISSGGAGEHALKLAIADLFGVENGLEGIEIAGRTDRFIARNVCQRFCVEPTPERLRELFERYFAHLAAELPRRNGRLLPGVAALLDALRSRPHVALTLLTGNLQEGARLKLTHYGVWDYFDFGAYADDSEDRNGLGPVAVERALQTYGVPFEPRRVVILGDTPHDIACGQVIGARTVAIATGPYSTDALAQHQPDHLYDDLSDIEAILADLGV
ncbi:MAG TPA: HAD family hydrolase [Chthoniobacteraceae bacterium]|nr:HAD family hydrolase [Chthoniobacteraceae bacterium]